MHCTDKARLFPFGVTVGSLTVFFIIIEMIIAAQGRLLPGFMMLGAFILLVLFMTGMIQTAILLFGASGGVASNCQRYVANAQISGPSANTLAWLQQNNICKWSICGMCEIRANPSRTGSCWYASFSFWLVGVILFIWMLLMSSQVGRGAFE